MKCLTEGCNKNLYRKGVDRGETHCPKHRIHYCIEDKCNNIVCQVNRRCHKHKTGIQCSECKENYVSKNAKNSLCTKCEEKYKCIDCGGNKTKFEYERCIHCSGRYNTLGKKLSEERKFKQSETLKAKYASGEIVVWNKGLTGELSCFSGSGNPMYQVSVKDVWIAKYGIEKAEEMWKEVQRKKSEACSGDKNPMFGRSPVWHIVEYVDKKGNLFKFKSTWELRRAKFLDENSIIWRYEEKSYLLIDRTYTPDFFIYDEHDNLIRIEEIKGYFSPSCKKKIGLFKKFNPSLIDIFHILKEEDLEKKF